VKLVDVIRGTDQARVRDEMIALKEKERRELAKSAAKEFDVLGWAGRGGSRYRAAALAFVGTATARTLLSNWWRVGWETAQSKDFADDVFAVMASRGRRFMETMARGLLRGNQNLVPAGWPLVRRAVREGVIDRPDDDAYITGMVFGVGEAGSLEDIESTYRRLVADPDLLEHEVWRLFEVDASSELASANAWRQKVDATAAGGYTRGENRWIYALARLADEGRLDRQRLLDSSLDALMQDFRATSVGWYARLHEELEPTEDERRERLDRYLALVTSPAPAVVKEGLAVLREIEDTVPPEAFARVAPTPFAQRQKNLSTETLSMLGRLCKRHPEQRAVLLEAAAHALGHERVDVQERALALLEQYPDDVPRSTLLGFAEAVSPTLRARVDALTGFAETAAETAVVELLPPVQPEVTPDLLRDELHPVESVDELIELASMLLEGQGDGDDCERFLDGVSRLCDERPRDFERRTAGLVKRARDTSTWMPGISGIDVVARVVVGWAARARPDRSVGATNSGIGFLAKRATEVAERARRGRARPLLAFPTHRGGWIHPDVLAQRESESGRLLNRPDELDRMQAKVRAFPQIVPVEFERRVKSRSHYGVTSWEFQYIASRTVDELGVLAAVAGYDEPAGSERRFWFGAAGWGGTDRLGVSWARTIFPALPEVAFAAAARAAVEARESTPYGSPDVLLELALDRLVPLRPAAWMAVAACLLAKSPDLPRVAVDVIVAATEDGRFDADALGEALAWLADHDLAKLNRLEAPFRDAARVSPQTSAQVLRTIEALLAHAALKPPRTVLSVLDVAVEASAASGLRVEDERARSTLERLGADVSRSSKLGKATAALL
jgi:Family of unknown function (DUF6493)